jgi:hypothetical protein
MRTVQRVGTGLLALTMSAGLAACGDDDTAEADAPSTTTTTEAAAPTEAEVTAVDYAFEGLPEALAAGGTLSLTNSSIAELHELVAFRLPDDEKRSVEELVGLPEEELGALFAGEPAMVLLAPPGGGEQIEAVGDGTLSEPGRYAVFCAIPTGADPDAYLNAPPGDGPPDVPGGPPHFLAGMYGDLTVE